MNKPLVLVVEDDTPVRNLITTTLKTHEYRYLSAQNGESAVMEALSHNPDIVLLDLGLPDMDGVEIIRKIRSWSNMPIIVISARTEDSDKIGALDAGADDYVTKPFNPLELVARVKSQLRRYKKYNPAQAEAEAGDVMTHAGLEMNVKAHQCLLDGKSLTLTPTEFSILQILLESKGTVVSAEELFYRIWADEYYSKTNNTITSHIRHLREKLNDTMDNPKYIRTIWGVGYKIED